MPFPNRLSQNAEIFRQQIVIINLLENMFDNLFWRVVQESSIYVLTLVEKNDPWGTFFGM